jgi:hypothetical protein
MSNVMPRATPSEAPRRGFAVFARAAKLQTQFSEAQWSCRGWGGTGKGVAGRPSAGGRRTIGGPRKRQRSFVLVEIERLLKHSPTRPTQTEIQGG